MTLNVLDTLKIIVYIVDFYLFHSRSYHN